MNGWLCQDCRSVNSPSANNCYSCWTPRKFAEAPDPATLPPGVTVEQAHAERKRQLRPSVEDARSSRRRSWVVLACITGTVAFSALSLAFVGARGGSMGIATALVSGDWTVMGSLLAISIVGGILTLASAIAWFVWFDRVIRNVPPLTGKWPEVSRPMAIVWWLVPVVGQFKGTFIVGHIYQLMAVAGSPGLWLLALWGITWIGGTTAPNVAGFVVGWLPLPLQVSLGLQDLISDLGQISYITSGFFAAALILAFEHAREVRTVGRAEEAAVAPEVPLEDRLAGRMPGSLSATTWGSSSGSGWPGGPVIDPGSDASADAAPRPMPSPDGMTGPSSWTGDTPVPGGLRGLANRPPMPGGPALSPAWPPGPPGSESSLVAADPMVSGSATESPPNTGSRFEGRGPIPFEPILLMGALVLAGVVGGITMAGVADPFGGPGRLAGQGVSAGATPTSVASPFQGTTPTPGTSSAAATPGTSSPGATEPENVGPTPHVATPTLATGSSAPTSPATQVPADAVARRLARMVTDERYRGVEDIDATYTDATGATTWSIRMGHAGDREWRLQELRPPTGDPTVLERVILATSVWERDATSDWAGRRRTAQDKVTPPLFDLTDASQLTFRGLAEEGDQTLYRFGWDAGSTRIRRFIGSVGADDAMSLVSAELTATDRGVPVRLDLTFAGDGSGAAGPALRMTVAFSEVGSDIEIRTPRIGPPMVIHH